MPGNTANLRKAAAARTAAAAARAENALVAMIKAGEPVLSGASPRSQGSPWTSSTATTASASALSITAPPAPGKANPPGRRRGRTSRQASCAR
jgi:hypothetical protein